MADNLTEYKAEINKRLGADFNIHLFWKGRVALYAILKAMGVKEGDEVILPAFTCVVVPNVIIYLGAKPVYADIDEKTFNLDVTKLEAKITGRTKVILAQNTFGLSPDMDEIMLIAAKRNILVVEDCAHGFGGKYKGRANGTIAHAAFFSSQWSKPYSTGLGGIAVTANKELSDRILSVENEAVSPSFSEVFILGLLMLVNKFLLTPKTHATLVGFYRKLSQWNLVVGSSQGNELEGTLMPRGFFKKMSSLQAKEGVKALADLDENLLHRKKIAARYGQILTKLNHPPVYEPGYAEHTFLRYSFLTEEKGRFLKEAEKKKLECGDWFVSPIHPIIAHFEKWDYMPGTNPVAENVCGNIVNLPTHKEIGDKFLSELELFLKEFFNEKRDDK